MSQHGNAYSQERKSPLSTQKQEREYRLAWKTEIRESARTLDDLFRIIPPETNDRAALAAVLERSPMAVPNYYLSLINFDDPHDPIRKLALPSIQEMDLSGSFDTSGEADNTVVTGLQHKYRETAMMLSTNECAMYCRHCFRKRLVGLPDEGIARDLDAAGTYIKAHPEITNILVSGGDALLNSNERIDAILMMLTSISHLDFIRIATRIPVSLPSRITSDNELLDILEKYQARKQLFVVTQFDHPREITPEATAAVQAVLSLGIPVRNQTVLLRGVNDDPYVLGDLLKKLTAIGAEPYYVFQCRPVSSVKSQFQVSLKEGIRIVEAAKALQNGMGKSFRYCMSHVTGKIEILGEMPDGTMAFKYHEAKDRSNLGRIFTREINDNQAWLDD
ncbi:MAG: KamA family radical SAM protein [Raoultibacter sp.]